MLLSVDRITGFRLGAIDGEIGHVREFYFDDHTWKVRYLVADTGHWLPMKKVLISPHAIGQIDEDGSIVHIQLTMEQIEKSPNIDADKPISRQLEEEYLRYFGWPFYWMDPVFWGAPMMGSGSLEIPKEELRDRHANPNLRSTGEINGYHIHARDGDIGHVQDFLINDEDWAIEHMVASTRNWMPGKKVLVSPQRIEKLSWEESKVFVDLTRDAIRTAPSYEPPEHHHMFRHSIKAS